MPPVIHNVYELDIILMYDKKSNTLEENLLRG